MLGLVTFKRWYSPQLTTHFLSFPPLSSLRIELICIPVDCTYLSQTIDMGINITIKCGIWEKWMDWLVEGWELLMELQRTCHTNWLWHGSLMSTPIFQTGWGEMLGRRIALNGFTQFFNILILMMFIGAKYSQYNSNLMLFVNWGLRQVQNKGMSITKGVHHHQKLEPNPHLVVISVYR